MLSVWFEWLQFPFECFESLSTCSKLHLKLSNGGAPTPPGTSMYTKDNWDMEMGYLWLNGWGIYHFMGGAFMADCVGLEDLMEGHLYHLIGVAFVT